MISLSLRQSLVLALTGLALLFASAPTALAQGEPGVNEPALKVPTALGEAPATTTAPALNTRKKGIPTVIDFYTMGNGDGIFSAWGHAAICVTDVLSPKGRCYNFGTTDFSDPVGLIWGFLRGNAQFWVSEGSLQRMMQIYEITNRTVWRQRLPLSQADAQKAAQALATEALPENRNYTYHHFKDNCATRLRDHIDVMMAGKLAESATAPHEDTYRTATLPGFAGFYPVTMLTELMLGSATDIPITYWEAMFLPATMRAHLEAEFGLKPEVLRERVGPIPSGNVDSGKLTLYAMAILFSLLLAGGAKLGGKALGAAAILTGLVYGFMGFLVWGLVLSTSIPELSTNRVMLFWLPLDFLLLGLRGLPLKRYALFRLGTATLAALLWITGILGQPVFAPLIAIILPMAALYLSLPETDPRADVQGTAHA